MTEKTEMCPILALAVTIGCSIDMARGVTVEIDAAESSKCAGSRCAWWTHTYTTEGDSFSGCALRVTAMSNGDGRIAV